MTSFSFIDSCRLLSVDPKTLRQWLTQARLVLHPHPTDARSKCLTDEHLHQLAALHQRVLSGLPHGLAQEALPGWTEETSSRLEPSEAELRTRLAHLEAQVLTLHTQLTDLALQLLTERQRRTDQQW